MTHDPFCRHSTTVQNLLNPLICTYCQLIREVREDERSKSA